MKGRTQWLVLMAILVLLEIGEAEQPSEVKLQVMKRHPPDLIHFVLRRCSRTQTPSAKTRHLLASQPMHASTARGSEAW